MEYTYKFLKTWVPFDVLNRYQPRIPVFHLQSLRFTRFHITTGPDGPSLTSEAVVRVEVRNPNHALKINYANTEVSLSTDGVDLGIGKSQEFTQAKMNTTVLKFTVPAKNQLVEHAVAQRLTGGIRTKRLVVATEIRTGIGVGIDGWSTMRPSVKVVCGGLTLKAIEGGAVPKCKITVFKWYVTFFYFNWTVSITTSRWFWSYHTIHRFRKLNNINSQPLEQSPPNRKYSKFRCSL